MFQKFFFAACILICSVSVAAQEKSFTVFSPAKTIEISISTGKTISWSVKHKETFVSLPTRILLTLKNGKVFGENVSVYATKENSVNEKIKTVAYKKDWVENRCNEFVINFKDGFGLIFRAYDNAAAYRFFTTQNDSLFILNEEAGITLPADDTLFIPHVSDTRGGEKFTCSFEEFYAEIPVSKLKADTLAYSPLLVKLPNNKKLVFLEADVQDYPEMFVQKNTAVPNALKASFAGYANEEKLGGYNNINYMVTQRDVCIAKTSGTKLFPWRALVISEQDKELLNCDIVYQLSQKNKIENTSWIQPGKVAWDWWNDWNISHVDFKAGINTPTYKYYIDFAAANKIEYVVLDEGWSDDWDLNKLSDKINLQELIAYGKQKKVGLILWSTWYALAKDIDGLCSKYSAMGVKGFKVDFLDRNDQKMIASTYQMAAIAAKHHLLLDFHGMFPPQGLQVTYPNVINFEGVRGMEYAKWTADERVPRHEVSLPFIRMMAGPMDYTPGAMRNATKGNAKPSNNLPVSQGTRCHQMAMYVVYDAPLQMLADNPTAYIKEQECTNLIASVPTVFTQTVALNSTLGEYVCIAKQANGIWYVGGLNNWTERDITVDLSFLAKGQYHIEIYKDGLNAGKDATDYSVQKITANSEAKIKIVMASGGGFVMKVSQ